MYAWNGRAYLRVLKWVNNRRVTIVGNQSMRNALAKMAVCTQCECNVSKGIGYAKIRQTFIGAILKRNSVEK